MNWELKEVVPTVWGFAFGRDKTHKCLAKVQKLNFALQPA
jgi:hypothetical protein